METLNFGDPIDLWEPWDDCGRFHIGYGICLNPSMGPKDQRSGIIVSSKIVFLSYKE
jgi:hypothetical protein